MSGKRITMAEHKRAKARGVHDRIVGSKLGTAILILGGGIAGGISIHAIGTSLGKGTR